MSVRKERLLLQSKRHDLVREDPEKNEIFRILTGSKPPEDESRD